MDGYLKRGKNLFNKVIGTSELEMKIKEATQNTRWRASNKMLNEICVHTHNYTDCQEIMTIVWARLNETGKHWRIIYKTLQMVNYLILHGSMDFVDEVKSKLYQIRTLTDFRHMDENNRDQGINVREIAKRIIALYDDKDDLEKQRKEAASSAGFMSRIVGIGATQETAGKMTGFGASEFRSFHDEESGRQKREAERERQRESEQAASTATEAREETKTKSAQPDLFEASFDDKPAAASGTTAAALNLFDSQPAAPAAPAARIQVSPPQPAAKAPSPDLMDDLFGGLSVGASATAAAGAPPVATQPPQQQQKVSSVASVDALFGDQDIFAAAPAVPQRGPAPMQGMGGMGGMGGFMAPQQQVPQPQPQVQPRPAQPAFDPLADLFGPSQPAPANPVSSPPVAGATAGAPVQDPFASLATGPPSGKHSRTPSQAKPSSEDNFGFDNSTPFDQPAQQQPAADMDMLGFQAAGPAPVQPTQAQSQTDFLDSLFG